LISAPGIIAITASARAGDKEKSLEVGMDSYIAKPMRSNDLVDVLRRCNIEMQ